MKGRIVNEGVGAGGLGDLHTEPGGRHCFGQSSTRPRKSETCAATIYPPSWGPDWKPSCNTSRSRRHPPDSPSRAVQGFLFASVLSRGTLVLYMDVQDAAVFVSPLMPLCAPSPYSCAFPISNTGSRSGEIKERIRQTLLTQILRSSFFAMIETATGKPETILSAAGIN